MEKNSDFIVDVIKILLHSYPQIRMKNCKHHNQNKQMLIYKGFETENNIHSNEGLVGE